MLHRLAVAFSAILLISALPTRAQIPNPVVQEMVDLVSLDSLVKHLRVLTGADSVMIRDRKTLIDTREMHTFGNSLAALYLTQQLSGPTRAFRQIFGTRCWIDRPCGPAENVYGLLQSGTSGYWDEPGPYYIISAHYDSRSQNVFPAPGADDNATGTAVVLEALRVIFEVAQVGYRESLLKHPIVFALWDAEEIGLAGSFFYAKEAAGDNAQILGVINLDMLGYDEDNDGDYWIMGSSEQRGFAQLFLELNESYNIGLGDGAIELDMSGSDHWPFIYHGYRAVTLTESWWTGDVNPYYHAETDTIGHLNLETYHKMAKLAVAAIAHFAMSGQTETADESSDEIPGHFRLMQNYPNPFNPGTTIRFDVPHASEVNLAVYDVIGRQVAILANGFVPAGRHSATFDARILPSGTYIYRLETPEGTLTKTMLVVK